jgi:Fur family ferric uptake transcriptional regulator
VLLSHCPVHDVHLPEEGQSDGFQLLFHTLEFFGLCRACRERQTG